LCCSYCGSKTSPFDAIRWIINILKPVAILTDALSGDNFSIAYNFKHIEQALTMTVEDTGLLAKMKTVLINDLKCRNYSSNVKKLIYMSSFLDPRFNDSQLDETNKTATLSSVHEESLVLVLNGIPDDSILVMPIHKDPPRKKAERISWGAQ
jgi:hypothetical protein